MGFREASIKKNQIMLVSQERLKGLLAKLWRHVFPNDVKPIPSAKTTDVTLEQGGYLCPRCDGFSLFIEVAFC